MDNYFGVIQQQPPLGSFSHSFSVGDIVERGAQPFRFQNMWLKEVGFKNQIEAWWKEKTVKGTSSFIISEKLKALKQKLKRWNKEFGKVEKRKKSAILKSKDREEVEAQRALTLSEMILKFGRYGGIQKVGFI